VVLILPELPNRLPQGRVPPVSPDMPRRLSVSYASALELIPAIFEQFPTSRRAVSLHSPGRATAPRKSGLPPTFAGATHCRSSHSKRPLRSKPHPEALAFRPSSPAGIISRQTASAISDSYGSPALRSHARTPACGISMWSSPTHPTNPDRSANNGKPPGRLRSEVQPTAECENSGAYSFSRRARRT